jgi:hypothetical protein
MWVILADGAGWDSPMDGEEGDAVLDLLLTLLLIGAVVVLVLLLVRAGLFTRW